MIVGLLSDAHGNHRALVPALAALHRECDIVLFAGDAMDQYRFSNEVLELLRDHSVVSILGNHDQVVLGPLGARVRAAAHVRPENLAFLSQLPERVELELEGRRLLMVHGSPWEPHRYVYPGDRVLDRFVELAFDFVILGHTHVPMVHRAGDTLVVNPGSIGESRGAGQSSELSYAVLDTAAGSVRFERTPNPLLQGA